MERGATPGRSVAGARAPPAAGASAPVEKYHKLFRQLRAEDVDLPERDAPPHGRLEDAEPEEAQRVLVRAGGGERYLVHDVQRGRARDARALPRAVRRASRGVFQQGRVKEHAPRRSVVEATLDPVRVREGGLPIQSHRARGHEAAERDPDRRRLRRSLWFASRRLAHGRVPAEDTLAGLSSRLLSFLGGVAVSICIARAGARSIQCTPGIAVPPMSDAACHRSFSQSSPGSRCTTTAHGPRFPRASQVATCPQRSSLWNSDSNFERVVETVGC